MIHYLHHPQRGGPNLQLDTLKILPLMSRFGGDGSRQEKKKSAIEKIQTFFERYFGL